MSRLEGVLIINKPLGLTSHDVVNRVRRLTDTRRIGHTGTLDPLATGLLILCIGRATRLAEYITDQNKSYQATIRLGQETNTYDAEGQVIAENPVHVSFQELQSILPSFTGEIRQVPPMFSAIKVKGKPLYHHARKGMTVKRKARTVFIERLEVLRWEIPELELGIDCSSGTYVRSIAHDLGQQLGCGGHLTALRRTAIGRFTIQDSVLLSNLNEENWRSYVLSSETAVEHLPRITFSIEEALALSHGQNIPRENVQLYPGPIRAFDANGCFIGIILAEPEAWRPHKIFYPGKGG